MTDPASDVDARLLRATRELRRATTAQTFQGRVHGRTTLDIGQADALEVLMQRGPLRMGDLAAALRIDASTATRTVDRLVEAGFAQRIPDLDDARVVVVAPTDEGRRRHAFHIDRALSALGEILVGIPPERRDVMADLLEELVAAFDDYVDARGKR